MRRLSRLVLPCFCALALPAPAGADTGFGPVTRIGDDALSGPVAAALGPTGAAAAGSLARTTDGTRLRVVTVTRAAGTAAWHRQRFSGRLRAAHDVRVTVTPRPTAVVSWVAIGPAQRWYLHVATGPAGGDVSEIGRLALSDPLRAMPQLVTLASGRVLLAYRDGPRLTVLPVLRTRLGARHVVSRSAGSIAAAAAADRLVLVWLDPYEPGRPAGRRLWAARMAPGGDLAERPYVVSPNASAAPQVAGGADGRAIATWLRPRSVGTPAAPFTRSLWPALRPARPLAVQAAYPYSDGAPAVALAGDASAVLAQRFYGNGPPRGEALFAANSRFGGVWSRQALTGFLGPTGIGAPRVAALGARVGLVVTTLPQASPSGLRDVVAVSRSAFGVVASGVIVPGAAEGAPALAAAGTHLLVAAPAGVGGFAVTERDG